MSTRRRTTESTRSTTTTTTTTANTDEIDSESEKVLEEEVAEMAKKVKEYRSTLPLHLNSTLSSLLASQRPFFSLSDDLSVSGPSSRSHTLPGAETSSDIPNRELTAGDAERSTVDVKLLKDKISDNVSAMPKVLKRLNECISRIDKFVSSDETIHPVFKRKKS